MKYNWEMMSDSQKITAIQNELNLVTHNATTKFDLLDMLRFLWDQFEIVSENKEESGEPALNSYDK